MIIFSLFGWSLCKFIDGLGILQVDQTINQMFRTTAEAEGRILIQKNYFKPSLPPTFPKKYFTKCSKVILQSVVVPQ